MSQHYWRTDKIACFSSSCASCLMQAANVDMCWNCCLLFIWSCNPTVQSLQTLWEKNEFREIGCGFSDSLSACAKWITINKSIVIGSRFVWSVNALCIDLAQPLTKCNQWEEFNINKACLTEESTDLIPDFIPKVRPRFTDRNMKTFVVVKSGNTVRLNINFEVLWYISSYWVSYVASIIWIFGND